MIISQLALTQFALVVATNAAWHRLVKGKASAKQSINIRPLGEGVETTIGVLWEYQTKS